MPSSTLIIPPSAGLYLYAEQDWGAYASKRFSCSLYSPSWDSNPRDTALYDAQMYVGGKVVVRGSLQTTPHIALVWSDDDAQGCIVFEADAGRSASLCQLTGTASDYQIEAVRTESVSLTNADGSLVPTGDTQAGNMWQYKEGKWIRLLTDLQQTGTDTQTRNRKMWVNGSLYITSGDRVFTPLGQSANNLTLP